MPVRALWLLILIFGFGAGNLESVAAPVVPEPAVLPMTPIPVQSRRPAMCTMEYRPVCAWRRGRARTYSNACLAEVDRASIIHRGQCRGNYREHRHRPWDWQRRGCVRIGPVWVCKR